MPCASMHHDLPPGTYGGAVANGFLSILARFGSSDKHLGGEFSDHYFMRQYQIQSWWVSLLVRHRAVDRAGLPRGVATSWSCHAEIWSCCS